MRFIPNCTGFYCFGAQNFFKKKISFMYNKMQNKKDAGVELTLFFFK